MAGSGHLNAFFSYHRRMTALMLAVCLAVEALLVFLAWHNPAWAAGFALGSAAQLFKFFFLDAALIRKIAAGNAKPASLQLKSTLLSLAVFGLMAAAGVKLGADIWAMAAGVFLPRLILLADAWIRPNPFAGAEGADA